MAEGDYEPFYLGEVRVTQADQSAFLAYGEHLPGGLWIYRGQVHLESLLDDDVGVGAKGRLTVTRWWGLSRKLTEAPRRGNWIRKERKEAPMRSAPATARPSPSSPPPAAVPAGFTRR